MTKENITKFEECYGCGVCVKSCPVQIIKFKENDSGFYSPYITDQSKCIECGMCLGICAYNHKEIGLKNVEQPKFYAAWNNNTTIRQSSTTGGIGYALAATALKKDYVACGVRYNTNTNNAEHILLTSVEDLSSIQGTKYIPSDPISAFNEIKIKSRYIIFGLPCQIDSFRRYITKIKQEKNFILVDLFCYGVPSLLLWKRTLETLQHSFSNVQLLKFRSKEKGGWHSSACLELLADGAIKYIPANDSIFYKLFFSNSCLNKCCYKKCKYKHTASAADIRIGDFWGKKYSHNQEGVNLMISLTATGDDLINDMGENCHIEPVDVKEALQGQMAHNAPWSPGRSIVIWGLRNKINIRWLYYFARSLNLIYRLPKYFQRIINLD